MLIVNKWAEKEREKDEKVQELKLKQLLKQKEMMTKTVER